MNIKIFPCARKNLPKISKRWLKIIWQLWRETIVYLPTGIGIAWKRNKMRAILSLATLLCGLIFFSLSLFQDGMTRWTCAYVAGCCVMANSFIICRLCFTLYYSILACWSLTVGIIGIAINIDIVLAKGNFWYLLAIPGILIAAILNSVFSSFRFLEAISIDRYRQYVSKEYDNPALKQSWKKFEEKMLKQYLIDIENSKTA